MFTKKRYSQPPELCGVLNGGCGMTNLNLQNNLPTGSAGFWQRLPACTIEIASRRYQVPQYMGVLEAVGGSAANQMRELLSVLCSICARVLLAAEFPDCNMSQSVVG